MQASSFPVLVGDIGGTNARFGLLANAEAPLQRLGDQRVRNFATIEDAVAHAVTAGDADPPRSAVLAAAGPVTAEGLDITNSNWVIEPNRFLERCELDHLVLFNDFDAQALALPHLEPDDLHALTGKRAPVPRDRRTKAVIGPGTGLGVGTLAFADGCWIPVGGEGGHVDAAPRSPREEAIWQQLETFGGRISGESILSGSGLENLFRAICRTDGVNPSPRDAADISAAALEGTSTEAVEALDVFCNLLGRIAGDLALTVMATGGVYIAGGIAPQILPLLDKGGFRSAFEDKVPHTGIMERIATSVVIDNAPALTGLAAYARNPSTYLVSADQRCWER